jgi:hypothetical protein
MNPEQLLAAMKKTYAKAKSFGCTGTTDRGYGRRDFVLAFERPMRLRIEYFASEEADTSETTKAKGKARTSEHLLIVDGNSIHASENYPRSKNGQELEALLALDSALGVSEPIQPILMLLPEFARKSGAVLQTSELRRLPDDILEGTECHRISGTLLSDRDTEIWIGKDDFAMHRLRMKTWFRFMHSLGIAEDLPDPDSLPFDVDCIYRDVQINENLQAELFHAPKK